MPEVVRYQDLCSGHGACAPRPNAEASTDVYVNSLGVHRKTDSWTTHCSHGGTTDEGSGTVFVNSLSVARKGDSVDCGSVCDESSDDVYAGD